MSVWEEKSEKGVRAKTFSAAHVEKRSIYVKKLSQAIKRKRKKEKKLKKYCYRNIKDVLLIEFFTVCSHHKLRIQTF